MHEHHHHNHEISSKEEQLALLKYMVSHNKSHTVELEKLAQKIGENEELTNAIKAYEKGNEHLENVLKSLEENE